MLKKIFVVLVNYNTHGYTEKCIESLLKTRDCVCRIVIVDNASQKQDISHLQDYCSRLTDVCTLLCLENNGGFAAGNNVGIRYALEHDADYVLLLNNDTVVREDTLVQLIKPFETERHLGVTTGKIYYFDNPKMLWYDGGHYHPILARTVQYHYRKEREFLETEPTVVNYISGCCMCIKREALFKVGELSEDYFMYEEDVDYSIRFQRCGYQLMYIPKALIWHKEAASSEGYSKFKQYYMVRNKMLLIKKNWPCCIKWTAYLFALLTALNRIRKKEYQFDVVKLALEAFVRGETGRTTLV